LTVLVGRGANRLAGADNVEAALCFYRALKVANSQQPVLDILAEMIAVDTSIPVGGSKTPSEAGSAGDLE
jgi:import receptor subunit TOM20